MGMKRGINKVTLLGNVGDDPRVNQINDEHKVARFPLATNEVYFDKEGNEVQKTEWHNVVFWNKAADIVEAYVRKGIPLYVEGKIQSSTWEDKDGNKRYSWEINGDNFVFIDGKREEVKEDEVEA
jgi:single-strand DNA-binding protein